MPTSMYTLYQDEVRKCKKEYDVAVNEFVKSYPKHIEDARKALNGMFNEKDYPTQQSIETRFGIRINFSPLPSGSDFRVNLEKDELSSMKEDVDQRVQDAIKDAIKDLWQRLAQPIKHMVEKLKQPDAVFRNTLIDNLKEIIEVIPALNVIEDPNLSKIVKECKEQLLKHTAEDLRDVKEIRNDVRANAEKLLKKMEGYI